MKSLPSIILLLLSSVMAATAQTNLTTTDSLLNTGSPTSTTYNAPGTNGFPDVVKKAANPSKSLWLMYDDPWGISSGSGTVQQTYDGKGALTTTINLTGLPGGGVDGSPFILYGCDEWMDCFQGQPPQFPRALSAMSNVWVDFKYTLAGSLDGRDIDMIFDEWICNSATPSDSSQCLEVEVLPYYNFKWFGGGTYVRTIQLTAMINGVRGYYPFDEYVTGSNVLFYPHTKPGMPAGELQFDLLTLIKAGVVGFGDSQYQYMVGVELGTEFGASSSQNYSFTLNKLKITQKLP